VSAGSSSETTGTIVSVRAELDVPGETGRQARIFALWALCLALAVVVGALVVPRVPMEADGTEFAREELARGRAVRAKVGVALGLFLPALITWGLQARYRRGGAHARGIVVDVTEDGELRVWGRGYGARVALAGAATSERLVDVYAGRLGAWRQRRLRVRGPGAGRGLVEIELATTAIAADSEGELKLQGGEGDCVELGREDFERVRAVVMERCGRG
jgi:hypothetical protein